MSIGRLAFSRVRWYKVKHDPDPSYTVPIALLLVAITLCSPEHGSITYSPPASDCQSKAIDRWWRALPHARWRAPEFFIQLARIYEGCLVQTHHDEHEHGIRICLLGTNRADRGTL